MATLAVTSFQFSHLTFNLLLHGGQDDKGTATQVHGAHQGQGHQARDAGAPLPACPWLPLPHKCQAPTRHPRHSTTQGIYANMNTTNKNKLLYKTVLVIKNWFDI